MDKAVQSDLLELLKLNSKLFEERIAPLTNEQALYRGSGHTNPILWIVGHLVNSRVYMLELLGDKRDYSWGTSFKEAYSPGRIYPSLSALSEVWQEVSQEIFNKLPAASHEALNAEISYSLPQGIKTVRGAFVFWLYHEAWHIGQIAFLRREQDMEGLVPY